MTEKNGKLIIHRPVKQLPGSPKYMWTKAFYDRNSVVANEADIESIIIACVSGSGTEDTLSKIKKGFIVRV